MSNTELETLRASDLATFNDAAAMAAYLQTLQQPTAADESHDSDVRPDKLNPELCMSKDSELLTLQIDGNTLDSGKFFYVMFNVTKGSRALWPPSKHPKKDDYKFPVCSTGMVDPKEFASGKAVGTYLLNEHFAAPYDPRPIVDPEGQPAGDYKFGDYVNFECARCPFNQFESEGLWDEDKKGSRGKACKESRTAFVRIMRKVPGVAPVTLPDKTEILPFEFDAALCDTPVRFSFNLGSNKKPWEDLILKAKARKIPLSSLVIKVSVSIERPTKDIAYPVFVPEIVGVPVPSAKQIATLQDVPWVEEFVARNSRKLTAATATVPF